MFAASYSFFLFSVPSANSVLNSFSSLRILSALCVSALSFLSTTSPPLLYSSSVTLAETIQKHLTDAMRAKDELRLSVLRMVKSAITYKETEKLRKLDEPESIQLLQTMVKQRKESIVHFGFAGAGWQIRFDDSQLFGFLFD